MSVVRTPKLGPDGRVHTQLRLSVELHRQLVEAADDRGVSVNWLINYAIRDVLPRLIPVDEIQWIRRADVEKQT